VGIAIGTDSLAIQTTMASKNMDSARRVPLIAVVPKLLFPFLVILTGILAIGLLPPHTTTVGQNVNGVFYRDATEVSPQVEQGGGLVPAKINLVIGKPMRTASGQPLLDDAASTDELKGEILPADRLVQTAASGLNVIGLCAVGNIILSDASSSLWIAGT
jgi:SSS family solute:Na+ symporter